MWQNEELNPDVVCRIIRRQRFDGGSVLVYIPIIDYGAHNQPCARVCGKSHKYFAN